VVRMCVCKNCETIQKHGTNCSICKCPVDNLPADKLTGEDFELEERRHLCSLNTVYEPEEV
jgi:hypothetical protein